MNRDIYRIECVNGEWTVRSEDGWNTYYFGNSYEDCKEWVLDHDGEFIRIIEE